jgi:epoxyqueuosine reductase
MGFEAAIRKQALEAGFDLVGIAPAGLARDLDFARDWVRRGFAGEMKYLNNPKRYDLRKVLPGVKSVVCLGLIYNTELAYSTEVGKAEGGSQLRDPGRGWISRYAWGRDYHEVMRAKLEHLREAIHHLAPGVETRVDVDTGPVVERAFARFSGIGWMGKNTCIINERQGSWFFLGAILTTLELEPDLPAPDRCGSCTACLEACPTGALVEPYVMDASRCIAYFTIELKGSIPEEFRSKIGRNVFGCDICQDVCPWNGKGRDQVSGVSDESSLVSRHRTRIRQPSAASNQDAGFEGSHAAKHNRLRKVAVTTDPEFQPMAVATRGSHGKDGGSGKQPATDHGQLTLDAASLTHDTRRPSPSFSLFNPSLEGLASMSEEEFRMVFAHSPIKRAKYHGWLRNLCVAMGNSGDRRFVSWLESVARENPDPMVREHAAWALTRLKDSAQQHQDTEIPTL